MIHTGSLVSDAGRNIAYIKYDYNNNPVLIYFTDGSETEYVYSATGEKLRVIYITAKKNVITREVGKDITERLPENYKVSTPETVDYLLGGALTLRNGRIDKYQFEEGYCQAEKDNYYTTRDYFTFCYYDQDHLGNIRQVMEADGSKKGEVIQRMNYYPFGAEFCDNSTKSYVQNHKYNGKEFDNMHGLNTYDYGARQYNPVTGRWDRMDPHSESYYNVSPYAYCHNNPVMLVDPNGMDDYYTSDGKFLGSNNKKTDYIYISDNYKQLKNGSYAINSRVALPESDISAKALSKIFTDIVKKMGCDVSQLDGGQINVLKWSPSAHSNGIDVDDQYGDCIDGESYMNAQTEGNNITVYFTKEDKRSFMFETRSNIQNMLGVHEYRNHFENSLHHYNDDKTPNISHNIKLFDNVMHDPTWYKTTEFYKNSIIREKKSYIGGN